MLGYGWSSDTSVAPPIDGNVAVVTLAQIDDFEKTHRNIPSLKIAGRRQPSRWPPSFLRQRFTTLR